MLVNKSTVDLRSISFSWLDAGKLFLYMDKSILRELCSWSSSLTNFSFCKHDRRKDYVFFAFGSSRRSKIEFENENHPKVRRRETVAGADRGTRRRVRVIGVDVRQQRAHHCRYAGAQVLRGKTVEVSEMHNKRENMYILYNL